MHFFLIIVPSSISTFFHKINLLFCYPPPLGIITWQPFCDQKLFLCMYSMCVGCLYHNHWTNSNFCCYIFLYVWSVGHYGFCFILRAYGCPPLLFPFTSVVCFASSTVRLHSSAWISRIRSSCCLNCVYRFPFCPIHFYECCITGCHRRRKIHKRIFHFTMFHVVGAAIHRRSRYLF